MPNEWTAVRLEEIADKEDRAFAMGPFGSNIRSENYRDSGVPVIRGTNLSVTGGPRFIADEFVYLSEEKANELRSSVALANDIVFVAQGTVGKVGIVPKSGDYGRYILSQNLMRVRLNEEKADPLYVYYFFQTVDGQQEIISRTNPTGVPCISRPLESLRSFEISLPVQVEDQRKISQALGSLDDKIELNRKMNETLEAMARALFKSWFVDFDPVRAKAEGRPTGLPDSIAALFPDSFEESELGDKPTGWKTGTFDDVAKCVRSTIPADQIPPDTPYIALEHMPKRSIALPEWGKADGVASAKATFSTKNILFGKLRPYFHKVGLAPIDGVCSTDIVVLAPKTSDWLGFALQHASSDAFVEYTYAGSTGTKMPRTSWPEMARYPMVIPPFEIAREFNRAVAPFYDRIIATIHQNSSLSEIRDVLLPKLISGEIRLKSNGTEVTE